MDNHETNSHHQINEEANKWLNIAHEVEIEKTETPEEYEKKSPEEKLGDFFNSESFLEQFESFDDMERERTVEQMLNCYMLFYDDEIDAKYSECFSAIVQAKNDEILKKYKFHEKMTNYFVESVSEKLGISEQDPNYDRIMFDYFNNRLNLNGYGFHAYNGVYDDSIKKNGLLVDRVSSGSLEEAKKLNKEVFSHYYNAEPFFYYLRDANRGEVKNIFYDLTPENVYRYGKSSPEWFDIFIYQLYGNFGDPYADRDYDKARAGIENWCKKNNASEEDRAKIFDFFDKNWGRYAMPNIRPKVALIPRKILDEVDDGWTYEYCKAQDDNSFIKTDETFVEEYASIFLRGCAYDSVNRNCDKNIPANCLKIIDLPPIV